MSRLKFVSLDLIETEWFKFSSLHTLNELASIIECNCYPFWLFLGSEIIIISSDELDDFHSKRVHNQSGNISYEYIYRRTAKNEINWSSFLQSNAMSFDHSALFVSFDSFEYSYENIKLFFNKLKTHHRK